MNKVRISRKDGTESPYFWAAEDGTDRTRQVVYKETDTGVKRMKGVHYDTVAKKMLRD